MIDFETIIIYHYLITIYFDFVNYGLILLVEQIKPYMYLRYSLNSFALLLETLAQMLMFSHMTL